MARTKAAAQKIPDTGPVPVQGKDPKAISNLYPVWGHVENRERLSVGLPATAGSYFSFNAIKSIAASLL